MIKKIVLIKSVGRFHNARPGSEGECGEVTLISAENGSGKTTIAAILHSLASGEPGFITERDTVSTSDTPEVKIILDDGCYDFKDGTWQTDVSDVQIEVFDTHFVNTNVYAGDYLEHGHKKALYQFIIGETAGELDKKIRAIDSRSRDISTEMSNCEADIQKHIVGDTDLKTFIDLLEVEDVKEKIEVKKAHVAQLKRVETLQGRSEFEKIKTFSIPKAKIDDLLGRTLRDVSKEAEEKLRTHIAKHTNDATEEWVGQGVTYAKDEKCPFCGSDTAENNTVAAFNEFFSDAYKKHKKEISQGKEAIADYLPAGGWNEVKARFESNESLFGTWREDVDFGDVTQYSFEDNVREVWSTARSEIATAFDEKTSAPLEPLELSDECKTAIERFQKLFERVSEYNTQVDAWNQKVDSFKKGLTGGDLTKEQRELRQLRNARNRHQPDVNELCDRLAHLKKEKKTLKKEKRKKKNKLDEAEETLMKEYRDEINAFLEDAGANFQVVKLGKSMQGGSPSANYAIEISGERIQLGSARTKIGKKGFRNILSEGDRKTLAFAFFYAKVRTDPSLAKKTIVIDDPVSSLDNSRQFATRIAIQRMSEAAKQVIVLSHDPRFLVEVGYDLDIKNKNTDSATLFVRKEFSPDRSTIERITPSDLKAQVDDKHIKAMKKITGFVSGGDTSDLDGVSQALRIVLEDTLSRRFPGKNFGMFSTSKWEAEIKKANPGSSLHDIKNTPYHTVLKDLNTFIHGPHHAGNLPGTPNRDVTQMMVLAQKVLKFVRGTL